MDIYHTWEITGFSLHQLWKDKSCYRHDRLSLAAYLNHRTRNMFKSQRYRLFFSCIQLASSSSKTLHKVSRFPGQNGNDSEPSRRSTLNQRWNQRWTHWQESEVQGGGCLVLPIRRHMINCASRWGLKKSFTEESKPKRPKKGGFLINKGLCQWGGVHLRRKRNSIPSPWVWGQDFDLCLPPSVELLDLRVGAATAQYLPVPGTASTIYRQELSVLKRCYKVISDCPVPTSHLKKGSLWK